jgi:hypothetical protein
MKDIIKYISYANKTHNGAVSRAMVFVVLWACAPAFAQFLNPLPPIDGPHGPVQVSPMMAHPASLLPAARRCRQLEIAACD